MGACLSSSIDKTSCAYVVSTKGELIQYPTPIFVSEVLQFEKPCSFVCNSDSLYYDHRIPALDPEYELEAGQIYFVVPKTMLHRRLTTSDMASLARKASVALDSDYKNKKKNKARISPLVVGNEGDNVSNNVYVYKKKQNGGRYSSKKARLSTIYEGSCDELQI